MTERTLEAGAVGAASASATGAPAAGASGAAAGASASNASTTGPHQAVGAGASSSAPASPPVEDGATIARLADDLLPALIARLGASGLGEIEVRRAGWKVRLRNPAGERHVAGGPSEGQPTQRSLPGHGPRGGGATGHIPHGTAAPRQGVAQAGGGAATASTQPDAAAAGTIAGTPAAKRTAHAAAGAASTSANRPPADGTTEAASPAAAAVRPHHVMATSPAVGYFQARKEQPVGSRVRAGDRVGTVDVLGVRQDVLAPVDGVIGASLVQPGEAVEYGQELLRIELPAGPAVAVDATGSDGAAPPERIESIGPRRAATGDRR